MMRSVETSDIVAVLTTSGLVRLALSMHGAAWGASTSSGLSPALALRMLCPLAHIFGALPACRKLCLGILIWQQVPLRLR